MLTKDRDRGKYPYYFGCILYNVDNMCYHGCRIGGHTQTTGEQNQQNSLLRDVGFEFYTTIQLVFSDHMKPCMCFLGGN